jgi:hypothetical protein
VAKQILPVFKTDACGPESTTKSMLEIMSASPGAIYDQERLFHQQAASDNGPCAAGA